MLNKGVVFDANAIKQCLLANLRQFPEGVGEYELIKDLEQRGLFDHLAWHKSGLCLFQKHFITMHCLYLLRGDYPGDFWQISPLKIRYRPAGDIQGAPQRSSPELSSDRFLEELYLDLSQLNQATEATVDDLMRNFWRRFDDWKNADGALAVLGLKAGSSWQDIQRAYRRQAQLVHPDKGGDAIQFAALQQAFESLKRLRKN